MDGRTGFGNAPKRSRIGEVLEEGSKAFAAIIVMMSLLGVNLAPCAEMSGALFLSGDSSARNLGVSARATHEPRKGLLIKLLA